MIAMDQFYWAPSKVWNINDRGKLIVNGEEYGEHLSGLFPRFYFLTGQGTTLGRLLTGFRGEDAISIRKFVNSLLEQRVLVYGIEDIFDLFSSQTPLFSPYNQFAGALYSEAVNREIAEQALRRKIAQSDYIVSLEDVPLRNRYELERCSTRNFNLEQAVSFRQLSALLAILRERESEGKRKYCYSSGGGLYPIDFYLYVKKERVESLEEGLYAYIPYTNELHLINAAIPEIEDSHYFDNRNIFRQSAFSLYFVFNAAASMPKYGGLACMLALLDCGAAMHALNVRSLECGLGSCSIGEMNFARIARHFKLDVNQRYLHCMEFGLKN
jgi:SagB-type dehydrogenase family enzyme